LVYIVRTVFLIELLGDSKTRYHVQIIHYRVCPIVPLPIVARAIAFAALPDVSLSMGVS